MMSRPLLSRLFFFRYSRHLLFKSPLAHPVHQTRNLFEQCRPEFRSVISNNPNHPANRIVKPETKEIHVLLDGELPRLVYVLYVKSPSISKLF